MRREPIAVSTDEIPNRSWLRMQPTFSIRLDIEANELQARIREAIADVDFPSDVAMAGRVINFCIPVSEQRFWSPHLSVQIQSTDDERGPVNSVDVPDAVSELVARYSPRPEIWTMFMAIYGVTAILVCGAGILAYVQWFLGNPPWALVLVPLGFLVIGCLHAASLVGQNLSRDQMQLLHSRLATVLRSLR